MRHNHQGPGVLAQFRSGNTSGQRTVSKTAAQRVLKRAQDATAPPENQEISPLQGGFSGAD